MVIGIVAKNGILLLDANQKFRSGLFRGRSADSSWASPPASNRDDRHGCGGRACCRYRWRGRGLADAAAAGHRRDRRNPDLSMVLSLLITPAIQFYLTREAHRRAAAGIGAQGGGAVAGRRRLLSGEQGRKSPSARVPRECGGHHGRRRRVFRGTFLRPAARMGPATRGTFCQCVRGAVLYEGGCTSDVQSRGSAGVRKISSSDGDGCVLSGNQCEE
jgi:hypothetical protein